MWSLGEPSDGHRLRLSRLCGAGSPVTGVAEAKLAAVIGEVE